jgi:carbon storage regulator
MLILGRKVGESIRINQNIVIKVVSNENGYVRLGIEAPPKVKILRSELKENQGQRNKGAISCCHALFD